MGDMSSGLQGLGKKGSYWRDGKLYSIMNDPQYGYLMPDGTPDTRWQTAPIRLGGAINEKLTDGVFGLIEGGQYLKDIDYATIPDRILGSLEKGAADLTVGAIEGGRYLKDRYNAAENWLDDKYDAVADWYNPPWERTSNPRTYDRGPLSEAVPQELLPSLPWGPTESHLEGIAEAIQDRITTPYGQIPANSHLTPVGYGVGQVDPGFGINTDAYRSGYFNRNLERDANQSFTSGWNQGWEDYLKPSHLTPGYDEMVNAGYDSWSPSDFTPILGDAQPYLTSTAVDTRSDWQKWKDSFKEDWKAK